MIAGIHFIRPDCSHLLMPARRFTAGPIRFVDKKGVEQLRLALTSDGTILADDHPVADSDYPAFASFWLRAAEEVRDEL